MTRTSDKPVTFGVLAMWPPRSFTKEAKVLVKGSLAIVAAKG